MVGRDSVMGIATRHGLDGPKTESQWGGLCARFSTPIQTGPGDHPTSCTINMVSFREIQGPGRGAEPSLLAPRLKEE